MPSQQSISDRHNGIEVEQARRSGQLCASAAAAHLIQVFPGCAVELGDVIRTHCPTNDAPES